MALIIKDRIQDTTTTTGTGAVTVSGTPASTYKTFSAVMSASDTTYLCIAHQTLDEWEISVATYSAANELTRTTVLAGTNGTSAVTFSAGTKDVFISLIADKPVFIDAAQTLTNKTITSPVLTTPQINDTSADHQYVFAVSELAADRTVTMPLLAGNDEFVFKDFIQTLTNKTLTSPTMTTPTLGVATATSVSVGDDAYAAGWNASTLVPTKNAVYDKIELMLGTTLPAAYQPLDADLTSWAGVTRYAGFDTFAATPSSANLSSLLTDKTGTGVNVFSINPTFTSSVAATATDTHTNTTDNATVATAIFQGDRATMAANDAAYIDFRLSDSAGNQDPFARIKWQGTTVTSTSEVGKLIFGIGAGGTITDEVELTATALSPFTSGGNALGTSSLGWNGAFFATATAIDFAGDYTITHSTGTMTFDGGSATKLVIQDTTYNTGLIINGLSGATVGCGITMDASAMSGGRKWGFIATADTAGPGAGQFGYYDYTSSVYRAYIDSSSNWVICTGNVPYVRATTTGTNQLVLHSGTAPVGVVNGTPTCGTLYAVAGEVYAMNDTLATATLLTLATPASIAGASKTFNVAVDSKTNFGKYFIINIGGTTYYVPCGTVAPLA